MSTPHFTQNVRWRCKKSNVTTHAIKTDGKNIVRLQTSWRKQFPVAAKVDGIALATYLQESLEHVGRFRLPAGAQLVPTGDPGTFNLNVNKLEFMDVFIQPTARVSVQPTAQGIQINTEDCVIESSAQVQQLGLSDRFDVDVIVAFVSQHEKQLEASAEMLLLVDVPFPFNLTPAPIFEAGGNLVVSTMIDVLMNTFTQSVVADYEASATKH